MADDEIREDAEGTPAEDVAGDAGYPEPALETDSVIEDPSVVEPDIEPDADAEPDIEPDTEPDPDAEPDTEPDSEPNAEPEPELDAEPASPDLTAQLQALTDEDVAAAVDEGFADEPAGEEVPAEIPGQEHFAWDLRPESVETGSAGLLLGGLTAQAEPLPVPLEAPAAEGVAPADDAAREVDLGPEERSRTWIWVTLIAVSLAVVLGIGGYVLWWYTSRAIAVPDIVGKQSAEAVQQLNDAGLILGKVSEIPTDTAPEGTIIQQKPEAGDSLKPGDEVSFVLAASPETVKVPEVSGKAVLEANKLFAAARLFAQPVETYSTTAAAGFVISQIPTAGTELPPGSSVAVLVSKGAAAASVNVPKVTGMTEAPANTLVEANQLVPAVYRSYNASIAAGEIITQTPLPGAAVAPGTIVQYLVSQGGGNTPVKVPDVVDEKKADADKKLKDKKLNPEYRWVASTTVPRGQVVQQMPPAGTKMAENGVVGVLVSRGNVTTAVMPSVVGTLSADASRTVGARGLRPFIIRIEINGKNPGVVFAQLPSAGTRWGLGLPVILLEAIAPK